MSGLRKDDQELAKQLEDGVTIASMWPRPWSAPLGRPQVHHRLTDSTNAQARALADAGAPHGSMVTADEQHAGRGRQGREWTAPPGSAVLMSLLLRDLDERHALLPLAAAVAVCEACGPALDAAVKWPNDVWIDRRKVAGILIEGRPQEGWAVLGIGINVTTDSFPPELSEIATSLRLSGYETTTEAVLSDLIAALDRWIGAPPEAVLEAWRSRDALKGERVRWSDGEGTADGIDDSGALRVQTDNGPVTLDAGEVHLLH
jgi:BirA family transcriptional regulator, biotin operon repressor / biotin---[acetyl-CoA-carboxylase] ligase